MRRRTKASMTVVQVRSYSRYSPDTWWESEISPRSRAAAARPRRRARARRSRRRSAARPRPRRRHRPRTSRAPRARRRGRSAGASPRRPASARRRWCAGGAGRAAPEAARTGRTGRRDRRAGPRARRGSRAVATSPTRRAAPLEQRVQSDRRAVQEERRRHRCDRPSSAASTATTTPRSGASGELGCLPTTTSPVSSSHHTRSVNVPPTSTPRSVAMGRDSTASSRRCLVLAPRNLQLRLWLRRTVPRMATVSNVADALAALGGRHLAGPLTGEALRVALVEKPAALAALPPGTVALLTLRASSEATGYRLDLALRRAGDAAVAASCCTATDKLPSTALRLAERAGLAVLLLPDPRRRRRGAARRRSCAAARARVGPRAPARRARRDRTRRATRAQRTIVEPAGRASGIALHLSERGDETHVTLGALQSGDPAAPVVQRLVADAVGRVRRRRAAPGRAALALARTAAGRASDRHRRALDGRGRASARPRAARSTAGIGSRGSSSSATRTTTRSPPRSGSTTSSRIAARVIGGNASWVVSVIDLGLVIAYLDRHEAEPPPSIAVPTIERVLAAVRQALPWLTVYVGLGGVHVGVAGLRASAAEARSALEAARTAGRPGEVVAYDATGLRRMLVEWLASDAARESVARAARPARRARPGARTRDGADARRLPRRARLAACEPGGRCTCTRTRSPTASARSGSGRAATSTTPTSGSRCSSPAGPGCWRAELSPRRRSVPAT